MTPALIKRAQLPNSQVMSEGERVREEWSFLNQKNRKAGKAKAPNWCPTLAHPKISACCGVRREEKSDRAEGGKPLSQRRRDMRAMPNPNPVSVQLTKERNGIFTLRIYIGAAARKVLRFTRKSKIFRQLKKKAENFEFVNFCFIFAFGLWTKT